jgi:bile acid:Na+ symporter, BASS family
MSDFFFKWNAWLGKKMFLIVLSGLLLGFSSPISDSPMLRTLVVALFAYMTFITSLETSFSQFFKVLTKPLVPLWILLLIHVVTPLLAWLIGVVFYPHDSLTRLGYLISASIPIGVTSIIWTSLTQGDVAVSLVAVTLDTLIAPVLLPAFFKILVGHALKIDYLHMAIQLLWMITIPSLAGMAVHDLSKGTIVSFSKSVGGFTSKIAFFFVIFMNAAVVGPLLHWDASIIKMLLLSLFMVVSGYFIGYLGSFALKDRSRGIVLAMIYNVGLRNISFGLVLALTFFPPTVAIPITLFMLYQQPIATLIPYIFRRVEEKHEAD